MVRRDKANRPVPSVRPTRSRSTTPEAREAWELSFHYFRAHRAYMARLGSTLALAPMQMHALRALEPGKSLAIARLSKLIFCDPANITGVVDQLEVRGLLERRSDPEDRRVKAVHLTVAGVALRRRVKRAFAQAPPMIACLSQDEQRRLRDLLRRIVDQIGAGVAEREEPTNRRDGSREHSAGGNPGTRS